MHYAEKTFTGETVLGGGELLLPGEVRLATGESYTSPWVFFSTGTGLDAVARRFHRHLRSRPRPGRRPTGPSRSTCGRRSTSTTGSTGWSSWPSGPPGWASSATCSTTGGSAPGATTTAGLGDWVVSPDVWPDGLHPLVDRVRELGMQFGLWFEPEMVNPDSDVARAHPEWMMAARDELPVPGPAPAGARPDRPRRLRARQGPDPGAARRVRHRLHQVGPQPRPRRGGQPAGCRPAGRARPDPGRLPAPRRDPRRTPRPSRSSPAPPAAPGSTSASSSAPTGSGCPTSSTRSSASTCCAGPRSSSRPSTWAPTSPPDHSHSTGRRHDLVLPGRDRGVRAPGHRVGPHRRRRRDARRDRANGSPSTRSSATSCSAATSCGSTPATRTSSPTASSRPTGRRPSSPSRPWATRCTRPGHGSASRASTRRPGTACDPCSSASRPPG